MYINQHSTWYAICNQICIPEKKDYTVEDRQNALRKDPNPSVRETSCCRMSLTMYWLTHGHVLGREDVSPAEEPCPVSVGPVVVDDVVAAAQRQHVEHGSR